MKKTFRQNAYELTGILLGPVDEASSHTEAQIKAFDYTPFKRVPNVKKFEVKVSN